MPTVQSITVGAADQLGTITCSVPVNAANDLIILAAVHTEAAGDVCSGMIRDGQSLIENGVVNANAWSRVEFWILTDPNLGTNTLTATVAGAGSDRARLAVWVIEDVDQVTPLRTPVEAWSDSQASSSISVSGVQATDLILDALTLDGVGHSDVVGANQTADYSLSYGASNSFEMSGSRQSGADGGAMSWTWTTACPFSHIAVAVVHTATVMQKLRPDADVVTTGWATAPLWSKIEEAAADGTVVTGVAS